MILKKFTISAALIAVMTLPSLALDGENMPKTRTVPNIKEWTPIQQTPTVKPFTSADQARRAPQNLPALPEINGCIYYPVSSPYCYTVSTLPDREGGDFIVQSPSGIAANGGGVLIKGVYYCGTIMSYEGFEDYSIFAFDANTWEQLSYQTTTIGLMATDMSLDPTSEKVYGCFFNDEGTGYVFGTIDFKSLRRTIIKPIELSWTGVAFDGEGNLFAIESTGNLLSVDKETGETEVIGNTGLKAAYQSSACIDENTGRMFYAYAKSDDTAWMYEIETTTAEATCHYQFPNNENVVGIYICPPRAEQGAPAVVKNLTLSFEGGSLTGNVNFTAPTHLYDGANATGDINYTITANGETAATGTTTYGAATKAEITLPADGIYEIGVTVSNKAGSSPAVTYKSYIGNDTPVAPTVSASYANDQVTISWNAVTDGVNKGYVNAAAMTYTVTRLSDNKVIAKDITETTATDHIATSDEAIKVSYSVTATAAGHTSQPGISQEIIAGPLNPPYSQDFSDPDCFSTLTVIDANKDGNAWYLFNGVDSNGGCARIRYNSSKDMDDWLIIPGLKLEAGKIYSISVDCAKEGEVNNIERFEVKYGKANTAEAMTETAIAATDVTDNKFTTVKGRVTPSEDGVYYIGIHGCSKKNVYWLKIDNIVVEAGARADAPDMVSNFVVTPGSYGRYQAEIVFNAPTTTFAGEALTTLAKAEIYRNKELIYTIDNPAPGDLVLYEDKEAQPGMNTYSAVAYNEAGEGKPVESTVFIGTKQTVAPKSVSVKESTTHGDVTISWTAPDKDIEGNAINPSALKYHVVLLDGNQQIIVAENHSGNSISHTPIDADGHQFVTYAVFAVSDGGVSAGMASAAIPVGTPYTLPYKESFADAQAKSILLSTTDMGNASWGMLKDSSVDGVESSDNDNGYVAMIGKAYNDRASLVTGKIDLRNAVEPVMKVKLFNMTGKEANTNPIEISVNKGEGYQTAKEITLKDTGDSNVWNDVEVDLTPYKGSEVWLKFSGKIDVYTYIMLDDIRVEDKQTGIEDIYNANDSNISISTGEGYISVSGAEGKAITICNIAGQTLYSTSAAQASVSVECQAGIYLVKAADKVSKVIVR